MGGVLRLAKPGKQGGEEQNFPGAKKKEVLNGRNCRL